MKKGYLKKEPESNIVAVQDQTLYTRNFRTVVYGKNVESICHVCGAADETVAYIDSESSKLAQKEYKQMRHENVSKMLHWKLSEKWRFNKAEKWYMPKPEKDLESESCKILCDFPVQTDKTLEHNRPDITVTDKKSKKCIPKDPAYPFNTRIKKKEEEKCRNYSELKYEIAKIWKMRTVEVIPVVIGALGTVTKYFEIWIENLDLDLTVEALQKPCLLGTVRMIRKVLDVK